ncbi:protein STRICTOSIDINE SYNTHASE-LIKE 10 [Canna indica]|uniref:Protein STRICTOSIDINE SYNTHASE-LIKE 10 n=1 Tax=Canna indica TaxID=4628 RepID=A0AAQ3JX43_9LILI|nr:protein STRICTOSIDINE SYNTHASE-LIKE 10 [Canna indica]
MSTAKLVLIAGAVALLSVSFSYLNSSPSTAGNDVGGELRLLPLDGAVGPESVAFDASGEGPYTGVSDGRILKWKEDEQGWIHHASVYSPELANTCKGSRDPKKEHVCGRPLGLQFNKKKGDLYVADAYFGLMKVGPGDEFAAPVAAGTHGVPFRFTNGLDIDEGSGAVYFTDSSKRFQRREFTSAIISGDATGRLMRFDADTGEVQVLLEGLSFPNGVALSGDASFLLLAETTTCRILKYWTQTPRLEVVAQLPGFPDNVRRSPRGGFWVAMHSRNGRLVEWALSVPWLRRFLLLVGSRLNLQKLSSSVLGRRRGAALAVRLSEEGEVLEALEGFGERKDMRFISEVEERNGSLWVGSVLMPFLGVYHLHHPD